MQIDADGASVLLLLCVFFFFSIFCFSKDAYHPQDKGIDFLANAGTLFLKKNKQPTKAQKHISID